VQCRCKASGYIESRFVDFGIGWKCVGSLNLGEGAFGTHWIGGWLGHRAGLALMVT
jgi:hypothetical protein